MEQKKVRYAALYERLSRDDELKGESNSITNQKAYLEDYIKSQGITNYRHFTDDGYSGTGFDRPGFQAMIAAVEAGEVDVVCVKDLSRFGRNYLKVGFYTEMLFPDKASVRARIREPTDMEKVRKEKQHCMTVLSDYRRLLLEWERTCSPVTLDEEWNPLFVEALHKKDYIDYLLDLLTDTPQIEMKALVAELGEEVRKIERRITELSADSHNRRSPKQLGADTER